MSRVPLVLALCVTLGGSGALVYSVVDDGYSTAGAGGDGVSVVEDMDVTPALMVRVERLETENRDLRGRLSELERTVRSQDLVPAPQPIVERAAELPTEVSQLAAALRNPEAGVPSMLVETVSVAMEQIRGEQEREHDEEREQRRDERMDERMLELTEALGLDPYQSEQMRDVLDTVRTAREELRDVPREERDRDAMREQMEALRTEATDSLSRVLTPNQIAAYDEVGGVGGDMGGGRGGDGGGGGRRRGR